MRIGYASRNLTLGCTSAKTFRLASYSAERLSETVGNNLLCLLNTLQFNLEHRLLFFRISSDIVPFASHEICDFPWQAVFAPLLRKVGSFVQQHGMRVSLHPGQYTLINALDENTFQKSVAELVYHAELLDGMGLEASHKIQIHVGGIYGDKAASLKRFIERYHTLPDIVRRRLVIEHDERLYNIDDCFEIHQHTGIPIVFDNFHHELNPAGKSVRRGFEIACETWKAQDGPPMVDYSSQDSEKRFGSHAASIDIEHFARFLDETRGYDFDVIFEIKDKESSALAARAVLDQFEAQSIRSSQ